MISFGYIAFLAIITFLFYILPQKYQRPLLFAGSLGFIGSISIPFLLFAVVFSSINYFMGIWINAQSEKPWKKQVYYLSLFINIGALIFFKYSNFFIENINFMVQSLSGTRQLSLLNVMLPIGISYYTFQCIGYIYRVYKGLEAPEKRYDVFTIYTLFFPKLLSGPIEKSNTFLPQLRENKTWQKENITAGLQLLLFGFFKKLAVADTLGLLINGFYGNMSEYSGLIIILVYLLQPVYIYFDFSGYTDIALGSAKLLGYNLTDNFNRPFFAQNVSTFWRRWHISLTTWCNDFVFKIVLFKKRKWKDWGAMYAVLWTFLLIGAWHGPRWNFIILGILQGVAINYEFFTKRVRLKYAKKLPQGFVVFASRIITYLFFAFSLIFFYAPEFNQATYFIRNMFAGLSLNEVSTSFNLLIISMYRLDFYISLVIMMIWILLEYKAETGNDLISKFYTFKSIIKWPVYYMVLFLLLYLAKGNNTFIYEQF